MGNLMRYVAALLSTLLLAGCGNTPADRTHARPREAAMDAPLEYLLTSAAADFHAHPAPYPARFRDVRLGYTEAGDGTRKYMLCGALLPSGGATNDWIPFATVMTSGYEQYIGDQAKVFCERSTVAWVEGDLSETLQSRLDSTQ